MKILVLGYYYRNNLGDEMFRYVFTNHFLAYFPEAEVIVKNTDDVKEIPEGVTSIICGGGDLINNYFLGKIRKLVEPVIDRIPVYAVGVGVPYPKLINEGAMDMFDYIIHRNQADQEKLLEKYGAGRVRYFPDLGFLLPHYSLDEIPQDSPYHRLTTDPGKKIGVFLSKTIYHPNNPQAYEQILDNLTYFLVKLARLTKKSKFSSVCFKKEKPLYQIYLIPSGTSDVSQREDDRLINDDVFRRISAYGKFSNIKVMTDAIEINQVVPIFEQFHFTVCTRFHAHVFTFLANKPVLSVYSSRKVENLLEEFKMSDYGTKMIVDPQTLAPIKLDCWTLFEKYKKLMVNYDECLEQIKDVHKNQYGQLMLYQRYLDNLVCNTIKYLGPETKAYQRSVDEKSQLIAERLVNYFKSEAEDEKEKLQRFLLSDDLKIRDLIDQECLENSDERNAIIQFISELISFTLTGKRISKFNYGLYEQVLLPEYNLLESVKWILNEHYRECTYEHVIHNDLSFRFRLFNMRYFKQHDLIGYHRSGWSYVINSLDKFHCDDGPIFDSFLDKTFGWNCDFYQQMGILPFKSDWLGFFHHTPDENYSVNNMCNVFKKQVFLDSLDHCRGLFVLSKYLQQWIQEQLKKLGYEQIEVVALTHPTEFVRNPFTYANFILNPNRKVVQVGAWLRNSYAIYELPTLKYLKKCALKGKDMDNYYLKDGMLEKIKECLYQVGCAKEDKEYGPGTKHGRFCRPHGPICRPNECFCHKYIIGLQEMIQRKHNEVEVMESLSDKDYDKLLSENVVFVNLVDASAVNTIIECIVRNTPIVINRLPAVVEYLGDKYPLYYQTMTEAAAILDDYDKLRQGHEYLCNLDKKKFRIKQFLKEFATSNPVQQYLPDTL